MPEALKLIDLRQETPSQVHTAAFYAVRELSRGEVMVLLTADEPSLMMQGLDLQLRNNLAWRAAREPDGSFRVEVRHRADVAPDSVIDLLTRHHKELDALLARAMHFTNAGQVAQAAPLVPQFGRALRSHVRVENELLAPRLAAPREASADDPVSIMLREHDEILSQLAVIEAYFDGGLPAAAEVGAFFAILSGTLAKHEYREENNLFPIWSVALGRLAADQGQALFDEVRGILESRED